jgi:hypothetical protein
MLPERSSTGSCSVPKDRVYGPFRPSGIKATAPPGRPHGLPSKKSRGLTWAKFAVSVLRNAPRPCNVGRRQRARHRHNTHRLKIPWAGPLAAPSQPCAEPTRPLTRPINNTPLKPRSTLISPALSVPVVCPIASCGHEWHRGLPRECNRTRG